MKLITAIIKYTRLDSVKASLASAGVHGLTLSAVSGFGHEEGHVEYYRGARYNVDLIRRIRVEVLAADEDVDLLVERIIAAAKTGEDGDGFVWVTPVDRLVRINTGQEGSAAL